jgi:hypothetical protein
MDRDELEKRDQELLAKILLKYRIQKEKEEVERRKSKGMAMWFKK